jgi:hypothetical protein
VLTATIDLRQARDKRITELNDLLTDRRPDLYARLWNVAQLELSSAPEARPKQGIDWRLARTYGTVTPRSSTPDGFCVGSSSVCTFRLAGGIVSMTNGTFAGLKPHTAGGDGSLATAAEQTPKV